MNGKMVEIHQDIDPLDNPELGRYLPIGMYFVAVTQAGNTEVVKVNRID